MTRMMIDDRYRRIPWDALDAVVFDVGHVLLTISPQEELEALFPGCEALHERLLRKIIHSPYWNMLDRGTLTPEDAIRCMTGWDEAMEPHIRLFMGKWIDFFRPIEEGVQAVRLCKAKGKRVYVLSNFPSGAFAEVQRRYDFFGLFDGVVVSARERMLKPNPDIYLKAAQTFGLDPARTLFIDDTAANIEGALEMGWQGLCYNERGKLARFMNA